MITESTVYWATRMDGFFGLCTGLGVVLAVSAIILILIFACMANDNYHKEAVRKLSKKRLLWSIPVGVLSLLFFVAATLIPTTKDYCLIKAIPAVSNSDSVSQKARDASELIDLFMARAKEELKRSANAEQEK